MKRLIFPIILIVLIVLEFIYVDDIKLLVTKVVKTHPDVVIEPSNEYKKNYDFLYLKQDNTYIPYSYGDIKNIIYSAINNGWDEFTFYCPAEYEYCTKDMHELSDNQVLLTDINNFASPFNAFTNFSTSLDDSGEINIKMNKLYSKEKIDIINKEIDRIINENITENMDNKTKIKTIHDYIINNTTYDEVRNQTGDSQYQSNTAYGTLMEHYAICSGYADTMALFLDRFGIENYKIASDNHIWNAVNLDGQWLHLDLTWDDPVSKYGPILDYKYFLITTKELKEADKELKDHIYDKSIYLEFN